MLIDEIPTELRPRIIEFLKLTDKHFSFLNDYGYSVKEEKIAKQYAVKNIIEVVYKNPNIDRAIIIHFEPNDIFGVIANYLSVSFYNGIKFLDRKLLFELYIKKCKPDIDTTFLTKIDKNNKSSFEENLETAMAGYEYFLKDIGIGLINGTEWEDGIYLSWDSASKILYDEQKRILGNDDDKKEN